MLFFSKYMYNYFHLTLPPPPLENSNLFKIHIVISKNYNEKAQKPPTPNFIANYPLYTPPPYKRFLTRIKAYFKNSNV